MSKVKCIDELKDSNAVKKTGKFLGEFKEFIARGNVIDLAIGMVIGASFTKIVTSLVNDILTPLLGILLNGIDFSGLTLTVGDAKIAYGLFIENVIDFVIVAACIFVTIKLVNKFMRQEEKKPEKPQASKTDELMLKELQAINQKLSK